MGTQNFTVSVFFVHFEKSIDQSGRLSRVPSDQGDANAMGFLKGIMILDVQMSSWILKGTKGHLKSLFPLYSSY